MILSGKYNEAMDKIKLSDELKHKIKKETAETVKTESGTVTLKKNGGSVHLATWQSGKTAYSLSSAGGLSDEEFIKIIESVK